jgi:hypothetical protein
MTIVVVVLITSFVIYYSHLIVSGAVCYVGILHDEFDVIISINLTSDCLSIITVH